jgi:hypothetical protein
MASNFEMKRVLIISPHFPPLNTADMHRVRQSLPYFKEFGWEAVVICVDEAYVESYSTDPLLLQTIPAAIEVHKVKAFSVKYTRKVGLGSLSMRSYWHIKRKAAELLTSQHFDLVYFSTTAFHVMAIGPYLKKKFKVPFVLDIQDPWRNDFYLDKPAAQRPPKFFISYNIDKWLEAYTVPKADGIISVSKSYCDVFKQRYAAVNSIPCKVISFGASLIDNEIMRGNILNSPHVKLPAEKFNIVYIGRGGHDMSFALEIIFKAFSLGLKEDETLFSKCHFWFIGTSYAQAGKGNKTIAPIATSYGLSKFVTEITDRIPYFETLFLLDKASMLLVPGSTDTAYTASKIYPYILAEKPLLALFYKESSVVKVLSDIHFGEVISFDQLVNDSTFYAASCMQKIKQIVLGTQPLKTLDMDSFKPFTAREKTKEQVDFFNSVIEI